MRRETLNNALKTIIADFEETGVLSMFRESMERSRESSKEDTVFSLKVFQKYMVATSTYGDTERNIMEILDISELLDTTFWERIQAAPDPSLLYPALRQLDFVQDNVPKLLSLISQDYATKIKDKSDDLPAELRGKEMLTALLAEDLGNFSSPERVVIAIKAISDLYSVHSFIEHHDDGDLILLSCDSGSDKSFDFLGAAKIISSLKETLIFIWDKVVFHRHTQARATIDVIGQTLPILEKIDEMEKNKSLVPELAEQLRRKALGACSKFVEAGVIIPEMSQEASQSPRLLMAPERKLLAGPATENFETFAADDQNAPLAEFTQQEEVDIREELRELRRRVALAEAKPPVRRSSNKKPRSPRKT